MIAAATGQVTLVIPVLNEERVLSKLFEVVAALDPAPSEIIAVDGGSSDATQELLKSSGWRIITTAPGRAIQINAGVAAATRPLICVLHADTVPPCDMVAVIEAEMADPDLALAGFTPLIKGPHKVRWFTTFHNWIKTWYAPLITRPHLFFQGVRLLFGDHAMFFRRDQYLAVGGCDPGTPVMEEADLCIKLAKLGKVRLVPRWIETSDRRIAAWGPLKANWIYFKVGIMWAFGARARLERHYPDVR